MKEGVAVECTHCGEPILDQAIVSIEENEGPMHPDCLIEWLDEGAPESA